MLVIAAGCAADSGGRDGASSGSGGSSAAAGVAGMGAGDGYAATVEPFIHKACNCHQSSPILMAPFSMKPGEGYANLVNAPSIQVRTMMRIKPGDPSQSYLWHKVNGTQAEVGGSGQIMPSTFPLNDSEKAIFERWIMAGAPP